MQSNTGPSNQTSPGKIVWKPCVSRLANWPAQPPVKINEDVL